MSNASFAGQFKVSTRIYTGFGLILILLIAVVALGYRALTHVAADVDNYVVYANQGLGVTRVRAEAADMRRTVLAFVDTGDEKSAAAVRQIRASLQTGLRDLSASFRSPERKAAAEQMIRMVEEYAGHFDKVEALRRHEKETIDNKLTPLAVAITADMSKILADAFADGFTENAALTGKAQERFSAARIRALRYISAPDAAVLQDFRSSMDAYARLMDDLIARLQVPERKQLAIDTKAKAMDYAAGFSALANDIAEARKLIYQVMAPLGGQFASIADKLADETSSERAKVELDAEAAIDANITTSVTVAIIALVSGMLLAVLAARSITGPVTAMTGAMTRLAAGDLTVDVPATADRDEIGEMAKAVLVFKDNAVQKKRMDEAEAARLAAEREQEEAQRRREQAIGAEIAALIDSVSKGELDRRIDLAGKDGFYKTMSEGVNRLTDTVQSVIGDVGDVLSALASGDLTKQVTRDYQGAFGKMKTDVNATSQRLAGIVGDITAAAETIASAAAEVSTGSTDLAERTEQQASSLEETAASMEELSGTVRSNADNAQRANRMAEDARRAAESGGGVAGSAIEAMKRIEDASRKITDIIGVIDEIAFQTNLLALNAAVEAARAGDAGRGFAVVAQEVRNLAQRSAQASKEIKALILDSDGQVKEGVDLVKRAGDALGGIVEGVSQVASLIAEMASASGEQASALDEINAAVAQMDEMTQKNAALVEETTAAAHAMADQARDLKDQIAFFKVDGRTHAAGAPRRAAMPTSAGSMQRTVSPTVGGGRYAAKPASKTTAKPVARTAAKPAARPASGGQHMEGALKHAGHGHDDDDWKEF